MTLSNGQFNSTVYISTHTLTWSVTFCRFCYLLYLDYFNSHAHVERDLTIEFSMTSLSNFNSHAHVERDHGETYQTPLMSISTHTLTWSVTYTTGAGTAIVFNFNSHAHVERDE